MPVWERLAQLLPYLLLLPVFAILLKLASGPPSSAGEASFPYPDFRTNSSIFVENLKIHFVPHSHFDPIWALNFQENLKLFDDFAQGAVSFLNREAPEKQYRFTFSDIYFLAAGYPQRGPLLQAFQQAFRDNRMELVNCGMSMPDQALTSYEDLLQTFEYGREYCRERFGILPRIGWAIDTFGQSAYMSRLYAEMGYEYQVNTRVNIDSKLRMKRLQELVFEWQGLYPEDSGRT